MWYTFNMHRGRYADNSENHMWNTYLQAWRIYSAVLWNTKRHRTGYVRPSNHYSPIQKVLSTICVLMQSPWNSLKGNTRKRDHSLTEKTQRRMVVYCWVNVTRSNSQVNSVTVQVSRHSTFYECNLYSGDTVTDRVNKMSNKTKYTL